MGTTPGDLAENAAGMDSLARLKSLNGSVPPADLLQQLASLEEQCRSMNLVRYEQEKLEQAIAEFRSQLQTTRSRKFRFQLSQEPEPEQAKDLSQQRPTSVHAAKKTTSNATLYTAHTSDISNCIIKAEHQAVLVENARDCIILARAHQVRLYKCHNCRVYSTVAPVLEECTALILGTFGTPWQSTPQDFSWMRDNSPNWKLGGTAEFEVPPWTNALHDFPYT